MKQNKVGAPPKFKVESTTMRISRVVPLKNQEEIKKKTNQYIDSLLINQLQSESLDKCVAENYKK